MTSRTSPVTPSAPVPNAPGTPAPATSTPATSLPGTAVAARPTLVRAGGVAAHVVAGTYVIGFGAMLAYLAPAGFVGAISDPAGSLAFLLSHQPAMCLWYLVLYLLGGVAMAVVALGVGERLTTSPALARTSTAFGLLWAGLLLASGAVAVVGQHSVVALATDHPGLALDAWVATSIVQDALGGGIEVVGAVWAAVVGWAVLRTRALPAALGGLALGLSVVGLATVLPAATETATSVFGLGLLVWFTWLATSLLRRR